MKKTVGRRNFVKFVAMAGGAFGLTVTGNSLAGASPPSAAPGVNPSDVKAFGAVGDGQTDDYTAFMNAFKSNTFVHVPPGVYKISDTIIMPPTGRLVGTGPGTTQISISEDKVAIRLSGSCRLEAMTISKSDLHNSNLVEVGSDTIDGGRSVLTDLVIDGVDREGVSQDGLQIRQGNLGTIQNIVVVNCGRHGISFGTESGDANAWTLQGYIDLRNNGGDGLHLSMGKVWNDSHTPRANFATGVCAQSNRGYGVYVGSRSNLITAYCESNKKADIYLDKNALGNEIRTVAGFVQDDSSDPKSNIIYNPNGQANYWRLFQNKVQFSGMNARGIRISNDDSTPGTLDLEKTGARSYAFRVNTGDNETISFQHDDASLRLDGSWGGYLYPRADNRYGLGTGSRRWEVLYVATGVIRTSDERAKQQSGPIDAKVLKAWAKVKWSQYKFNNAVEQRGDKARWHFGLMAQQVKEAFESEGLDPFAYGLLCYDEWKDEYEDVLGDDGRPTGERILVHPAGSRYGLRYEEALVLECTYLRSLVMPHG